MDPIPQVDFTKIRVCLGTQHGGFEELSVSLFRAEFGKPFDIQRVQGSGGDGGVEAFLRKDDGDVVGMQAKFFRELESSQWTQIEKSIDRARQTHADLKMYYVTVPLDRTPKEIEKWAAIVDFWKPNLELVWLGKSELLHLLSEGKHHGRLRYWFGSEQFDEAWLARHNDIAIRGLDARYTPLHHVQTESEKLLDSVARADSFTRAYAQHLHELTDKAQDLMRSIGKEIPPEALVAHQALEAEISLRLPNLGKGMIVPPLSDVRGECESLKLKIGELWQRLEEAAAKTPNNDQNTFGQGEAYSYERQVLHRFWNTVQGLAKFTFRFECANFQLIALLGPAGAGKSHLLANRVETAKAIKQPVLLLLGEYFLSSEDPWHQLVSMVGWEGAISDLLASLNYAAEVAQMPALICVDALNESNDRRLWKSHLQSFAGRLKEYPNVRLVISCREDFASLTLPNPIAERRESSWSYIDHEGFGENIFEAVSSYLSGYKIQTTHFPPLLAEFQNPLFLKTFCEAFAGTALPEGSITLSVVMEARIEKACDQLLQDIDCPADITRKAIEVLAEMIENAQGHAVPRSELRSAIDSLFPGRGESQSLYRHLRSNGLLVEIAHQASFDSSETILVRFPFERFSEYFIADRMLRKHADIEALRQTWNSEDTFAMFAENQGHGPLRGLARAMAILVPERFRQEFINLLPDGKQNRLWLGDYLKSLSWRSPESFTADSKEILQEANRTISGEFLNALFAVASIPSHPYNADFLHKSLKELPLSDRELAWTIPVSGENSSGASHGADAIVKWAFRVPLDLVSDTQAELVARVLTWLCSSNHRALRFRATLAAIRLLSGRSNVAARLIRDFHDVNDPYVVERVYAMAAGVAMRERNDGALGDLASAVFDSLFDREEVPPNILVRDFGRCVMEIANQRGALPRNVDEPGRFRPRYPSTWPDIWREEKVKAIEKTEGWHAVASSVQPEGAGMYGDFGRYTMQAEIHKFSAIKIDSGDRPDRKSRGFDPMIARRWVVQRVVELGWTPERFGKYEQQGGLLHGRQRVDIERWRRERIGKKYQWIALNELTGFLSDHYCLFPEWNDDRERIFSGAWQTYARDFDPSQPLRDLEENSGDEDEVTPAPNLKWWQDVYPDPFGEAALCADPNAWVRERPTDFRSLIEWRRIPNSTGQQLSLGGYYTWYEPAPLGSLNPRPGELKMWCNIRTWLVREEDFFATRDAIQKIQFWGEGAHTVDFHNCWLGSYPWGDEFAETKEYCAYPDPWVRDEKLPIEQGLVQWSEDDLSGFLPAPRLVEILGIHWSGYDFDFINNSGNRIAFSPFEGRGEGSGPLFVQKEALIAGLRNAGWEILWAIVGDRSCWDSHRSIHIADSEMHFSAVYWLEGDLLAGGLTQVNIESIPRHAGNSE